MATAGAALRPLRQIVWLLTAVSGTLLLGALGFQHLGGLSPCEMCQWQRWAHLAVLALGGLALLAPRLWPLPLFAMLVASGLGLFHAGVEQKWWQGPTQCAAGFSAGDDLLGSILAAPLVRCDQIPWSFLGLSMAGWNALISATALVAALAIWRRA
ncbi:disulfide bond formation protein B [Thermaurantiacus sp.]